MFSNVLLLLSPFILSLPLRVCCYTWWKKINSQPSKDGRWQLVPQLVTLRGRGLGYLVCCKNKHQAFSGPAGH